MCLILFAYQKHPIYKLIVAANRDESYKRQTAPAKFWEDNPDILAGRDLEKMGTWMGVTKGGKFAALTNYRAPNEATTGKRTRGELVSNALGFQGEISEYMEALAKRNSSYPGYNLLAGDATRLYYYSNVGGGVLELAPGVYGLSNHLLDTDWPKVKQGKEGLEKLLSLSENELINELFQLLSNEEQAPDELLPRTGVPLSIERMLSSLFIKSQGYGTRCSTVLLISDHEINFMEREFFSDGTSHTQAFLLPL